MATQQKKQTTNLTDKQTEKGDKNNLIQSENGPEKKESILEVENEKLRQENAKKDETIKLLQDNFEKMQEQIETLMKANSQAQADNGDKDVVVCCRAINGGVLATADERYMIKFLCDEEKYVDIEDLKTIFKESGARNVRRLFEEDVFYFKNAEDYSRFKIKKRIDLSRENIMRILMLPSSAMIDEVNKLTNNLVDFPVVHNFQFEIVKMLVDPQNPLKEWKYDNRNAMEKYLNRKFDDLMAAVGALELIGRKKFN